MFPPFRIRKLHGEDGGNVQLQAGDYDTLVEEPAAQLTYLDEDDGETITVGSSLELRERLEEPPPPSRYSWRAEDLRENPMHVFDVTQSDVVLDKWRKFQVAQPRLSSDLAAEKTLPVSVDDHTLLQLEDNARRYLSRASVISSPSFEKEDIRERWFRACDPPQLSAESSLEGSAASQLSGEIRSKSPHLTVEGERKAREAGEKLRRKFQIAGASGTASLPPPLENRWASYQVPIHHKAGTKDEDPERRAPSFLEAFEEELSKQLANDAAEECQPPTESGSSEATEQRDREATQPPEVALQGAGDLAVQAVQVLAAGVGLLGTEMSRRFPGLEERISQASQTLPTHIDKGVTQAVSHINDHAEKLSTTLQQAAGASRAAAEATRQADLQVVDEMLNSFIGFAGEVGKTLWTTFQDQAHTAPTPATTNDRSQPTPNDVVEERKQVEATPVADTAPPKTRLSDRILSRTAHHGHCVFPPPCILCARHAGTENPELPIANEPPRWDDRTNKLRDSIRAYRRRRSVAHVEPLLHYRAFVVPPRTQRPPESHESRDKSDRVSSQVSMPDSLTTCVKPILDQEDTDADFSARFPSLMSSDNGARRDGHTNPRTADSGFLRNMSPEAEIARYPTVSQLEKLQREHPEIFTSPSNGCSGVLTAPQVPLFDDTNKTRLPPGAWPDIAADNQQSCNGVSQKESSGAFFERMTGRRASAVDDFTVEEHAARGISSLRRAHTTAGTTDRKGLVSADPAARLPAPFDPLDDLANELQYLHPDVPEGQTNRRKEQPKNGVQAKTTTSNDRHTLWSQSSFSSFENARRPYSMHFTGAGRTGALNSFITSDLHPQAGRHRYLHRAARPQSSVPDFHSRVPPSFPNLPTIAPGSSRPGPVAPLQPSSARTPLQPALTIRIPSPPQHRLSRPPPPIASRPPRIQQQPPTSSRPSLNTSSRSSPENSKITDCMFHLLKMGYCRPHSASGSSSSGVQAESTVARSDLQRLHAYATAADGNVSDAIEIIEEERKAWDALHKK